MLNASKIFSSVASLQWIVPRLANAFFSRIRWYGLRQRFLVALVILEIDVLPPEVAGSREVRLRV